MSHTNNFSLIVLLLLVLHSSSQLCALPSSSSIDLLQAGTALISNSFINTSAKRQHQFTFTLNFNAPNGIKVAASASTFQITASNGIDFSIWGGQGTTATTGLILLLINQDNTWSSIRVSYLASGRSDFFLGSFSAAPYFPQRQSQSNVIALSEDVTGWTASPKQFHVVVQLAGVKTSAINPVISLTTVSFNQSTGTILTTLTLNTTLLIETVVITYIIADKSSSVSYSPFNVASGSTATYQFFGIDQVQIGSSIIAGNGFTSSSSNGLTCVGSGCPTSCLTSQVCITYFGVLTATNCFICATGQIVSNGKCVAPSSPCGTNQYFNGTNCVCNNGYIFVGSACYVSCGVNAYVLNSQCQCIPGFMYSALANQCIAQSSLCGANYVMINNQCICPSGFGVLNNQCVVCPANSFVDANGNCACANGMVFDNFTNVCTSCNTLGRAIVNGRCGCSSTFYPTDTICVSCISFSTYNTNTKTCVCNQNYSLVNGNCVSTIICPTNSTLNTTTQQCVCNTQGQYIINGVCQTCQQFSAWNGSSCVCQSGYILVGQVCIQNCSINSYWNGFSCVCNATYFNINGTCLQCDVNSFYSSTLSTCICNNGFFGTFNNCTRCHSSCLTCSGASSSQCLACPTNTNLSNGACLSTCSSGTYLSSTYQCLLCDSSCATCSGSANTQCLTCPSNANLINGACRVSCSSGTYLSNTNQCLSCDSSCATCSGPGNALCTSCSTGTTLQNGVCRSNSNSSVISKISTKGFVLGNQVIYQGVAMNLMPTAILSSGCTICNNLFLINVNSRFSAITVTQQFLNNSQYWFIISFNFPDANSIPTFQFTIKINPIHANFFTLGDMAQLLTGSFSQSMFNQATMTGAGITGTSSADTSSGDAIPSVMAGNVLNPTVSSVTVGKSSGISDKTIQQIFGTPKSTKN